MERNELHLYAKGPTLRSKRLAKLDDLAAGRSADEVDWLGEEETKTILGTTRPDGAVLRLWWD